jgi:Raf kinase inhibitor-like YbhB/YbcL family protein
MQQNKIQEVMPMNKTSAMKISSSAFAENATIPMKYTCQGDNVNPPLHIDNVPQATVSFVLIVDDPDAPMGTWVHWVVWNIAPVSEIHEDSTPQGGRQGLTSAKSHEYSGPCPPSGTHRYFFKVYALDTTLQLDANATKQDVESAMDGHIIERAELIGLYKKV